MIQELIQYKSQAPEIVFEWNDRFSEAKGWVVINSLRGGAAGGGTRMRKGLDKEEVISLAKVMEIKFTVSGPPIGGAKSGINFDPKDPRKDEVLRRWYAAVSPLLKEYYGTGGDLNVDETKDVVPITEDLGIWHPQAGIVNGHFQPKDAQKIKRIGQLRQGVSKIVEDPKYAPSNGIKYNVADLITGYGVAQSIIHYYDIFRQTTVADQKVIVQGWGNVAGAAAYYLAKEGAKITGIIDKDGGIINKDGLSYKEVTGLFTDRVNNVLTVKNMLSFDEVNEQIWDVPCDIFVPGAASRLVTKGHLDRLLKNGLSVISSGANVPFEDKDVFFGETAKFADENCSLIPDFIANCGMARVFAYLMSNDNVEVSDIAIFEDVSNTIREAFFNIYRISTAKNKIAETALHHALTEIFGTKPNQHHSSAKFV